MFLVLWISVCSLIFGPLGSCLVAKLHLTLCNPMDCSPPGSSVCGVLQAGTLGRVAVLSSRGSSRPRDGTGVSCTGAWILYPWARQETQFRVWFCLNADVYEQLSWCLRHSSDPLGGGSSRQPDGGVAVTETPVGTGAAFITASTWASQFPAAAQRRSSAVARARGGREDCLRRLSSCPLCPPGWGFTLRGFLSSVSRMPPIAASVFSHSGWPFTAAQILYFAIKSEFAS